jgi:hypothetical protein
MLELVDHDYYWPGNLLKAEVVMEVYISLIYAAIKWLWNLARFVIDYLSLFFHF